MDLIDQAILKGFSKKMLTGIASITPTSTGFTLDFVDGSSASYTVPNMHTHSNKAIIDLLDVDADGDLTYNGVKVIEEVKEKTDLITTTGTGTKFLCDDGTYKQPTGDVDLSDYYTKEEVDNVTGDITTLEVYSVSDIVSAINKLNGKDLRNVNFSNKKITFSFNEGTDLELDISTLITDTSIDELSDVDTTDIEDGQVLKYDIATGKFLPGSVSGEDVLQEAKDYTDDQIANIEHTKKMTVDEKPTYADGTITYKVDGAEETTTDDNTWFFYDVDGVTFQTLFINGVEKTIQSGTIDDSNFLSKDDVSSTYTGEESDKSKVADLAALKALETIIKTSLNLKVNTSDIVDNLVSSDSDKPLSANQGKELADLIESVSQAEQDHESDEVAHLTLTERENLLTKDDIAGTISDTPSDEKVASEKAVSDAISEHSNMLTVTKEQYDTLATGGTVTIDEKEYAYDSNTYYIITDDTDSVSIVNAISSSSTDNEIPTAKAVNDKYKLVTYTELTDMGLAAASLVKSTDDVATVVNAMVDKSMALLTFAGGQFGLPTSDNGTIEIKRHNVNRVSLIAVGTAKTLYYGTYHSTSGFSGWKRACMTTVDDVPKTTFNLNTMSDISFGNISAFYLVSNGICTVDITFNCTTTAPILWLAAYDSLPIPKAVFHMSAPASGNDTAPLLINVNTNGTMEWYIGSAVTVNRTYYVNFSYSVAES